MTTNVYSFQAITVATTEQLRAVVLPVTIPRGDRVTLTAQYLSTMRTVPTSQREIVEQVFNLFQIALPEFTAMSREFKSVSLTKVALTLEQATVWVEQGQAAIMQGADTYPSIADTATVAAAAVDSEIGVYAGVASVLFALGRQANESASAAIATKRPDALIRRFHIPEDQQGLLPGKASGPTVAYLEAAFNAFSNYTEIRANIVQFMLAVKAGTPHLPIYLEVVMTNFTLMRGAGMTHVDAVIKLAQMHPWTLKVPELEPYYQKFVRDLTLFEAIPETIRPYHRLLESQNRYLFLSAELRPLVAVAGDFIQEVEATFSGYVYNKDAYAQLIAKVRAYAPHYRPTGNFSAVAITLGVRDEPLPEKKEVVAEPEIPTV